MGLETHVVFKPFETFVKKKAPNLVFLQETRLQAQVMETKKYKLGFNNCLTIEIDRRSGGLALLWNLEVSISVLNYLKHHIHAFVSP